MGITWAWVFVWWQISDLVKVVIQKFFRTAEGHVERCKRDSTPLPAWVAALDKPNQWASRASDIIMSWVDAAYAPIAEKLGRNPRRGALSQQEFRSTMSMSLNMSRQSGMSPNEVISRASRKSSGHRMIAGKGHSMDSVAVDIPPTQQ